MWRERETSREQVQEAARHPDPEVSGRAKWILRQWRRGSLPNTPPEVFRLLQQANGPAAAIERLLEGGQFEAAMIAVEESAGTVDREAIQQRLSSALLRRFPIYVQQALLNDALPDLLRLIDIVADSKELAVCRIQLMQQMGTEFDVDTLLPKSATTWNELQRQQATALLYLVLGQPLEAIEVARDSSDEELLNKCRMIAGRWSDAAAESLKAAQQTESGTFEHARRWGKTLMAADRAGNKTLFDQALRALSSVQDLSNELAAELRWRCLASHGEIDEAFAILDRLSPDIAAALSIDASRTPHAFEVLDFPLERIDTEVSQWVDDALQAQRDGPVNELSPQVGRLLALMQVLISVGHDQTAWDIANRVCDSDLRVSTIPMRVFVLSSLTQTRHSDWVVKLAVGRTDSVLSRRARDMVAYTLPQTDEVTFQIVMRALATMMRERPIRDRLDIAYLLLKGAIPEGFDPAVDFRRLYQFVVLPETTRIGGEIGLHGIRANLNVVELFSRHGEVDLASDLLQRLIQTGDIRAQFHLAERELESGRSDTARSLFETVYKRISGGGRGSGQLGTSDDAALAVKALIGQWTIAQRSRDEETSAILERQIRLALCSPSLAIRNSVAEYLGKRGETKLANEALVTLLPMAALGSAENTSLFDVAREYAIIAQKSNPREAVRWFDLAVVGTLESMDRFQPRAYVSLPLYVRRSAIELAIDNKDEAEASRHLDRILKLDPLDIDFAERLLPKMRDAGLEELAGRALDSIMDEGIRYSRRFPFDAMISNNLAWAAAMNEKRLDEALDLSRRAVYVEPDSAIYRDTLAEVLFLLDRKVEALQVEQGCLLDEPSDWHMHQQVEKYKRAVAEES